MKSLKTRYRIFFYARSRKVYFRDREITPERSLALVNHSPDGFAWGYGGSGPAQLALALLLEFSRESDTWCVENHQYFKQEVIAKMPQTDCDTTPQKIRNWVEKHKLNLVKTYDLEG